jgi:putative sigma-54 modulation protein
MKMTIQTPNMSTHASLLDFVLEKVGKLGSFSEKIVECRVQLKVNDAGDGRNKVSVLKLIIPGQKLFACRQGSTFEEAVLQAVEALKPQIERWKSSMVQ